MIRFKGMQVEVSDPISFHIKCDSGQMQMEMQNCKRHIAQNFKIDQESEIVFYRYRLAELSAENTIC